MVMSSKEKLERLQRLKPGATLDWEDYYAIQWARDKILFANIHRKPSVNSQKIEQSNDPWYTTGQPVPYKDPTGRKIRL